MVRDGGWLDVAAAVEVPWEPAVDISGGNAWLSDATATGTIENTDAMPRAWLARFGRTVAGHVLDAVAERMTAPRSAGLSATLGGQALPGMDFSGDGEDAAPVAATPTDAETAEAEVRAKALSDWLNGKADDEGDEARRIGSRTVTGRELVLGSAFSLTGETAGGGTAGFWGRAAVSADVTRLRLALDCCSARSLDADRRGKVLIRSASGGSNDDAEQQARSRAMAREGAW